ncbi:glutamate receptor 2.8-like isoform X2 [Zingiber officinale]|uniref:glutamate receptor 2.8-like isoform X2 n=1 Tax=Zingiber officinale TaxID=94328 RepID=UPI001C4C626C|nr:glutamate receptor 2.8-like isoform X2 [Zingiber officinale]
MKTPTLSYRCLAGFLLLFSFLRFLSAAHGPSEFKVGLILDMNSTVGKVCRIVAGMAHDDFYAAHPASSARLRLLPRDSHRDVLDAAAAAMDLLVNEEVHAILGPQTSVESPFVADLGEYANVPVVSFSATSPAVSPSCNPFFVRAAASDAAQVAAIAALVQAFAWTSVVPVYEDSDYGTALLPVLADALDAVGAAVPYRCAVSLADSDDRISAELYRLKTLQTRVFVAHVTLRLARRLFPLVRQAEMMAKGSVWIVTEGLTSQFATIVDSQHFLAEFLQGVIGVKPYVPWSPRLRRFNRRWRREFLRENHESDITELNNFGIWAYDAVWAVAAAANRLGPAAASHDFRRPNTTPSSTDFSRMGVSSTGPKLLNFIKTAEFEGLAGRFRLHDGELAVAAYQIVNVDGGSVREIGFWTEKHGLSSDLNSTAGNKLRPVIWPGYSTSVPRGWETPTGGRRLQVVVPGSPNQTLQFQSFVSMKYDSETNQTRASGFVIDVFEAAVRRLPYALPFDYIPYRNANGSGGGDYNALVKLVADQVYDAVVGDVSITANRSLIVDFTLPFTVSGVSMVVPLRDGHSSTAWIFHKPLTADLWLTSVVFFIFTGAVVWILEHRTNEEFQGTAGQQMGITFYFAFSTLVFAHRENLTSNLSRMVVIIWVFVVLILQSSYTASLTSMLTVQKLNPTLSSFEELNKTGLRIGYLNNSFTKGLLLHLGFQESRLRPFRSPEQYHQALADGSVAAIVDEVPYLRVFLRDYCNNYSMAEQIYKTSGFGFVFRKGSPLVADLSRAILNLTEGNEMTEIERKWFGDQTTCPNQGSVLSPDTRSLNAKSFWGLFLITGAVSLLCCLFYSLRSVYRDRLSLTGVVSGRSFGRRLLSIARLFDGQGNGDPPGAPRSGKRMEIGAATAGASPSSLQSSSDQESRTSTSDDSFTGSSSPELGISQIHEAMPHPGEPEENH